MDEVDHRGVGRGVTRETDDELDVAGVADGAEQVDLEWAETFREVHHGPGQPGRQVRPRPDGGAGQEVALVVPARSEQPGELLGHPGGLAPAAGTSERGERGRTGDAELAVEIPQGDDGGGVLGDGAIEARRGAQHLLDGEVDDRGGDGLAALVEQRRRPEHLGEAKDGEDVDGGRPAAPAERPSGHHAGRVGGDDDRHRDQRVVPLAARTAVASASRALAP